MAGNQGLSQDSSMSDETRDRIHSEGGKASRSTSSSTSSSSGAITNKSGGGHLTPKDQSKGGKHSHGN
jgi:hypothetical protein